LWGWRSEGRKIAWVAWDKVCKSREAGGLGIINVRQFNLALLRKWIWRLNSDKGGLWREVIESRYGGWRGLKERRTNNIKVLLWWRDSMRSRGPRNAEGSLKIISIGRLEMGEIFCFGQTIG